MLVSLSLVAALFAAAAAPAESPAPIPGLDAARAAAAENDRRVLLVLGEDDAAVAVRAAMKGTRKVREKLTYEYDVVHVETGREGRLTVLAPDGKVVAREDAAAFLDGERVDAKRFVEFLTEHQAARRSAKEIVAAAKERAKAEGKRVFLHFGAPWCGNCHELEDWMASDEVRPLLEKEFVDCKVDIDRTIGGRRLLDRTRTGEPGGIPWFCFLSPDGEKLVESNRESDGKNVGFPRGEANHVHVRKMLETGAVHLTADDIDALIESLP